MARRTCFDHELGPGQYRARPGDLLAWATMRCADCSGLSQLLRRRHSVDPFGRVTPQCVCGCGATRELVLLDWVPEPGGRA